MIYGSLFAGIGGFDLGFDRAGMVGKWQVENDPYCWKVLWERWPHVDKWDDVRTFPPDWSNEWNVDVICGGFPCQDISDAGTKLGLEGARSGLWREFARVLRALRPKYVVVENTPALLRRGMDVVLSDLSGVGYDAIWEVISACSFGASHTRRRLFIVAYANGLDGRPRVRNPIARQDWSIQALDGSPRARLGWQARLANPSELYGGADGVPNGPQRNHAIGNAVCPDIAEWIGKRIVEAAKLEA
jgi:DNA (cytosine-5)-methyltransferase 1